MGDVKALDYIDTDIILSRGYKLNKVFLAKSSDRVLETFEEAMAYAEELADKTDAGVRAVSLDSYFYIDVYILKWLLLGESRHKICCAISALNHSVDMLSLYK